MLRRIASFHITFNTSCWQAAVNHDVLTNLYIKWPVNKSGLRHPTVIWYRYCQTLLGGNAWLETGSR